MARVQALFIVACLIVSACSGGNVPAASTPTPTAPTSWSVSDASYPFPNALSATRSGAVMTFSWGPIPTDLPVEMGMFEVFIGPVGFNADGAPAEQITYCRVAASETSCEIQDIPEGEWDAVVFMTSVANDSFWSPSLTFTLGLTASVPSASPSPIASASTENSCNAPKSPPSTWPAEAVAALEAMTARYMERCATIADFELHFSLPEGLTTTQEALTKKWYSDALTAATRVFGDLLQSTKPIAVFYKTSAESMCTELVAFLEQESAAADVIDGVKRYEWSCKPNADWTGVYSRPGYGATILEAKSPKYDYLILNMGNGDELRSKDPYAALNPTFQTPSHELFHLAQFTNQSQAATLWWGEGGAAYIGHLTAAMQGMVTYKEARDQGLVAYSCEEIARNGKSGPPRIAELSGWWDSADGKWWNGMVYSLGALASEYVIGTYGWDAFYTWASGYQTKGHLPGYLDQRSQQTFGISLDELHKNIDKYLERVLSC